MYGYLARNVEYEGEELWQLIKSAFGDNDDEE